MTRVSNGTTLFTIWAILDLAWKIVSLIVLQGVIAANKIAQYAGVIAAFALSCSSAVVRTVNYDDILATAHQCMKESE